MKIEPVQIIKFIIIIQIFHIKQLSRKLKITKDLEIIEKIFNRQNANLVSLTRTPFTVCDQHLIAFGFHARVNHALPS